MTNNPTVEHLNSLLNEIHDEAVIALASGEPASYEKALSNIAAMGRYKFDPNSEHDRIRNKSPEPLTNK